MSFLNTEKEIRNWLYLMKIENYTIVSSKRQLVVDVNGIVSLYRKKLTKIPVKFNIVKGSFDCSSNELESLEGCPEEVGKGFYCENNKLQSLKGCPKEVKDNFWCKNNKITKINNPLWVEYFQYNTDKIKNNQLLDINFLDVKYKELFKTMTYDFKTIKENRKEFKQFLDSGLITLEQTNLLNLLDLWR